MRINSDLVFRFRKVSHVSIAHNFDCSYVQGGSLEITLEISCCKHPPEHTLRQFWAENIRPLIRLMEETHRGVKGKRFAGSDSLPDTVRRREAP